MKSNMFEYQNLMCDGISFLNLRFENDVKMYGIQTNHRHRIPKSKFENDVKMYGIQTLNEFLKRKESLRMM